LSNAFSRSFILDSREEVSCTGTGVDIGADKGCLCEAAHPDRVNAIIIAANIEDNFMVVL